MITNLASTEESLESLARYHSIPLSNLKWDLVFMLPDWLKVWWLSFGSGTELYIRSVRQNDTILGIAPLQIRDNQASFIGSVNVCDYQDFITAPGRENEFFNTILDDLKQKGIQSLHLETVRPDSSVTLHLIPLAKNRGLTVDYHQTDVSLDMSLPQDWEKYLGSLNGKQRHEIRRKMRHFMEAGESSYRVISDTNELLEATGVFLQLFPDYRRDKAEFMTTEMQSYFRDLAGALAETGVLRYGILEYDRKDVAMIMYFDYHDKLYLYNSVYHPDYKNLSVGIISKVRCIQDSIERKKKLFDFLKGNEPYKYYLGGKEIPLYSCRIDL